MQIKKIKTTSKQQTKQKDKLKKKFDKNWLIFFLIFLLALTLRFFALSQFPPGLYPDEAVNATDGLSAWEAGELKWYYPNNNGREGLFINLLALALKLFGVSIAVMRAVPALIGTLTVLAVFLLAKEMFNARFGFLASFLVAGSFWHLNFSRIGFRAIFVPLIISLSFYLLFKGYHKLMESRDSASKKSTAATGRGKKNSQATKPLNPLWFFLLAGLAFGIGFHTYIAFRIAPAIIFVFFALLSLANFRKLKEKIIWQKIILLPALVFGLGVIITASPIVYQFLSNPAQLNARQNDNSISVFDPANNQGDLLGTISKTFLQTLGQLIVYGDQNWRHNLPPFPELEPFVAIMWLAGLILIIGWFLKSLIKVFLKKQPEKKQKENTNNLLISGVILSWFLIMLSPAFLTVEGLPHALRSIGSLVPAYLIAALMISFLWNRPCPLSIRFPKYQNFFCKIKHTLIVVGLAVSLLGTIINYFYVWGPADQTAHAFEKRLVNIGEYLKNPDPYKKYFLIVNIDSKKTQSGFPVSLETIRFVAWNQNENPRITYLLPEDLPTIAQYVNNSCSCTNIEIILQQPDDNLIQELQENLPEIFLVQKDISLTPEIAGTEFKILKLNRMK